MVNLYQYCVKFKHDFNYDMDNSNVSDKNKITECDEESSPLVLNLKRARRASSSESIPCYQTEHQRGMIHSSSEIHAHRDYSILETLSSPCITSPFVDIVRRPTILERSTDSIPCNQATLDFIIQEPNILKEYTTDTSSSPDIVSPF